MNPILYRYKDTEAVIKVMDGYTPGDGWSPLYGSDEVKAATDAALERAEKACEEEAADIRSEGKGCHTGQYDHMADGAGRCAQAIRALKEQP